MVSWGAGAWLIASAATDTNAENESSLDVRMAYTLDHVHARFNRAERLTQEARSGGQARLTPGGARPRSVHQLHGPEDGPADDFEAAGRDFVHRVGVAVMELAHSVVVRAHAAELGVDDVDGGDP